MQRVVHQLEPATDLDGHAGMEDAQVPHLLFTIEDTFLIKGRGLILAPGISTQSEEHVRIGDALRLIRPDGSTVAAQLVGLEMFGGPNRMGIPILVRDLGKEDVPIGTEVWTVDAN